MVSMSSVCLPCSICCLRGSFPSIGWGALFCLWREFRRSSISGYSAGVSLVVLSSTKPPAGRSGHEDSMFEEVLVSADRGPDCMMASSSEAANPARPGGVLLASFRRADCEDLIRRNPRVFLRTPVAMLAIGLPSFMFALEFYHVCGALLDGERFRSYSLLGVLTDIAALRCAFGAVSLALELDSGIVGRLRTPRISQRLLAAPSSVCDFLINVVGSVAIIFVLFVVAARIDNSAATVIVGFPFCPPPRYAMSGVNGVVGLITASLQASLCLVGTVTFGNLPIALVCIRFRQSLPPLRTGGNCHLPCCFGRSLCEQPSRSERFPERCAVLLRHSLLTIVPFEYGTRGGR